MVHCFFGFCFAYLFSGFEKNHSFLLAIFKFINSRECKDIVINERGRNLIGFADRNDLVIAIGGLLSNIPAQFTYANTQGKSIIALLSCKSALLNDVEVVSVKVIFIIFKMYNLGRQNN